MPNSSASGLLIALDGIDGCGKTTQLGLLARRLESEGRLVVTTREPTSGFWGKELRRSAIEGRLDPTGELEVILNDRREDVELCIKPALANGAIVLVDRYYTSTLAYQVLRGLDPIDILERNLAFAPAPDLIVLLKIDPAIATERIRQRGLAADKFEDLDQLRQVALRFDDIDLPRLVRVDALRSEQAVHDEIYALVRSLLEQHIYAE